MSTVATAVKEAPAKRKARTPEEVLKELEAKAVEYKISDEEFYKIRAKGQCPNQIQTRIKALRDFIAAQ